MDYLKNVDLGSLRVGDEITWSGSARSYKILGFFDAEDRFIENMMDTNTFYNHKNRTQGVIIDEGWLGFNSVLVVKQYKEDLIF